MAASGSTPERYDGQDRGSCHVSSLNTTDLNYSDVIRRCEVNSG
jgi:hypothetical protein